MIASGLFQADSNPNTTSPPPTPTPTEEPQTDKDNNENKNEEGKEKAEEDFWTASWQIIDGFCPSLKEDVFAKLGRPLSPYINPLLLPATPPPISPSTTPLPPSLSVLSPPPSSPPPLTQEPPPVIDLTQPIPEMPSTSPLTLSSSITISDPPAEPIQEEVGEPIPHFADSSSSSTFLDIDPQQEQLFPNQMNSSSDSAIYNNQLLYNYNIPGSSSPLAPHPYPSS